MYEYNKAAIEIEIVWLKVVKEPSGRFFVESYENDQKVLRPTRDEH